MNDPFQVLGVSASASEDEIKQAYRRLAKKYHPDLNPDSATAEAKMREINEAYSEAMKIKKSGGTYRPNSSYGSGYGGSSYGGSSYGGSSYGGSSGGSSYGGSSGGSSYGGSSGGSSYGGGQGGWNPFGGFGFDPFGFGHQQGSGYSRSGSSNQSYDNPELQAAQDYINSGRFQEAINLLNRIPSHDAPWHYLFARANLGLGNRVAALNSAKQAASMDPDNEDYRILLEQLGGQSSEYRSRSGGYDFKSLLCANPCLTCCLLSSLFRCLCGNNCCGGSTGGGGGYYGWY